MPEELDNEPEVFVVNEDPDDVVFEEWSLAPVEISVSVTDLGSVIHDKTGGGTGVTTGTGGHSQPSLSGLWHLKLSRHLIKSTANSVTPMRPTGLHNGPTHSQVQEGNSTRTPFWRYLVLVDSVAVQVTLVTLEVLSVRVTISRVEFQMLGDMEA